MLKGILKYIHPVLPVKDVAKALSFYKDKLGFGIAFTDDKINPKYAGVYRDHIEIHLQWHDEKEWEATIDRPMLRVVTENIDALFEEYSTKEVFHEQTTMRETPWGTKEFAFYDLYKNGLTFYVNL